MRNLCALLLLVTASVVSVAAAGSGEQPETDRRYIAVFLPDEATALPLYDMTVSGAKAAAAAVPDLDVDVSSNVRRGDERFLAAAADNRVELIIVAGGALIEDAAGAAAAHPQTPFLMVDGAGAGPANLAGILINRREQAFLAGYIAGLRLQASPAGRGESSRTAGLLIETGLRQSEQVVRPAFLLGLKAAGDENAMRTERMPLGSPAGVVRSRVEDFSDADIPVMLSSVYTNSGTVVQAVRESGIDALWLDTDSADGAGSQTLAAVPVDIEALVERTVMRILESGPRDVGTIRTGFAEGTLRLETDFDRFATVFSESEQARIRRMADRLASGDLVLRMPAPF